MIVCAKHGRESNGEVSGQRWVPVAIVLASASMVLAAENSCDVHHPSELTRVNEFSAETTNESSSTSSS